MIWTDTGERSTDDCHRVYYSGPVVKHDQKNKYIDKGTTYSPISLLSVIAKTLKKKLLPYITANIRNTPTQVMQNAALSTVTGCTEDTTIQYLHDETLTLPIHEHLQIHASQYKQKTQHPSHPLHKHTTYFNTPRLKKTIFNNGRYTTNIPTDPHKVATTDIKTNMRHIHKSIVSRYLATRGNNKILRTPPPHISSSEEILPRLTRRTLTQLRTNKSPFLKSYLHKFNAKTHPSPLCPLCNIHTHDTHHLFNCTHIRTTLSPLDLWTDPAGVTALLVRWTEKLAGGPQAGTLDSPH